MDWPLFRGSGAHNTASLVDLQSLPTCLSVGSKQRALDGARFDCRECEGPGSRVARCLLCATLGSDERRRADMAGGLDEAVAV
jgi:hypothetical protein